MDNFEWEQGYEERFGIVHVDFETWSVGKDSAKWYSNVLEIRMKIYDDFSEMHYILTIKKAH